MNEITHDEEVAVAVAVAAAAATRSQTGRRRYKKNPVWMA